MVSPLAIAERLQVRAPSVTGMLKRLADGGWIDYEPGCGARLTPLGITEARRVIRRHRLVELLLTRVLGLDWSEVDAEAEALEHAISPRLEQAIAAHLGEPLEDPHGHPIPTPEGAIAHRDLRPLHTFRPGQRAIIREARDDSPERLRRWYTLGFDAGRCRVVPRTRTARRPFSDSGWRAGRIAWQRGTCRAAGRTDRSIVMRLDRPNRRTEATF